MDHFIEALWRSRKMKKFENLKNVQKSDFAGHCPIHIYINHNYIYIYKELLSP